MRPTRRALVYGAVAIGAALVALGPISDGDIFWHVAAGDEIFRRRALLHVDPFTVSAAGRPWVDVHWLFQLLVSVGHRLFGFRGLAIGKALLLAAGAVIGTHTAERGGGPAARDLGAVVLLGLLFLARHLVPLRPILVTLLFIAVFLAVLEWHRVAPSPRSRRALLALVVLEAIWVNCQGLAAIGPALIVAYLIPEVVAAARASSAHRSSEGPPLALTALAVALGACLLASCITPYGFDAVRLPARLLARIEPSASNVFSTAVAENIPPFVLERTAPELASHFAWVLLGLAAALLTLRPRLPTAHVLILVGFATLALMATRNVPLFYWVLAPLGASSMARELAARLSARSRAETSAPRLPAWASPAILTAAVAAELAFALVALAREPPIGSPTPFHFPTESARLLARMNARGPVFAPDHQGGYLTLAVPGLRPYIDTRLVLHSAREYEDFLSVVDEPARFDDLDARERFAYVVLTTSYPDRYLGLVAHLASSPGWTLIYTDGSEVLFARTGARVRLSDGATVDAIAAELDARFDGKSAERAAARLNLARMLVVVGEPVGAERVLHPLTSRAATQLRARIHFAAGELGAAETLSQLLLVDDADDIRSLTLLAEIAIGRQSSAAAREYLARALSARPYDPEARAVLARLEHGADSGAPAPAND
jgi:hypothetical protein